MVQKEERRVAMEDFIVLLVKREAVAKDGRLRSDMAQFIIGGFFWKARCDLGKELARSKSCRTCGVFGCRMP